MSKLLSTIFLLQVGVWALADAGELSFLVVGDWGGQTDPLYTTPAEVALAEAMGGKAAEIGSQFTLSLGDNFYDNGVTSVDDARFNETFEVSSDLVNCDLCRSGCSVVSQASPSGTVAMCREPIRLQWSHDSLSQVKICTT